MLKTPAHYRPGLDFVRLAALLPVLCYHFCIEAAWSGFAVPDAFIGRAMADWVELGLAWFFLLSGAALCLQWQGRFRWRPYLAGRAAAMYPPFWLCFGALFLYGEVLHGNNPGIPRWRVIFSILGLDGYLSPLTPTFYKVGEWFLGVILLLYLLFPLLLWCLNSRARRYALLAAMVLLQLGWPALCPAPLAAGHTVLGRLPAFALGVWFGSLLAQDRLPLPRALWALAGAVLLWVPGAPRLAPLLAVSAALFWVLYALGQKLPRKTWGVLRRLAAWSYGVYLIHHVLLTLVLLPAAQRTGLPLPLWFPVFLAMSFALAAVLAVVSAPISRQIKRLG